jgi:hypothetical protein
MQPLRALLTLDRSQFTSGLNAARGQAGALAGNLRSVLLPVAGAIGVAFSARALWQGVMQGAQEIDTVAKSARALGGSIGGVRAMELAFSEAGGSVETLRADMQKFNQTLASGAADQILRDIGLSAADLRKMDVDERLATVADRMKDLGFDAGQTNAALQKMGIENKDLALVVMQGGDALRAARDDVADYGLALDSVDAGRIEAANDQLGRLSIVGQYLRQELASALLPALGSLAEAFTNSMREGGVLRGVIDALSGALRIVVDAVSGVVNIVASAVGFFADMVARVWDWVNANTGLSDALRFVWDAISGVVTMAYNLVTGFSDLIDGAGGFGNALAMVAAVGGEVFDRLGMGAEGLGRLMSSVASAVQGVFLKAFGAVGRNFAELTQTIAEGINNLFSKVGVTTGLTGIDAGAFSAIELAGQDELGVAGRQASQGLNFLRESVAPLESVKALRDLVSETRRVKSETGAATEALGEFNSELEKTGGAGGGAGGGGGGAARAAEGVKGVSDQLDAMKKRAEEIRGTFKNAFVGLVTGTKSFSAALTEVLSKLANMLANAAFDQLFSGKRSGGGGLLGNLFGVLFGGMREAGGAVAAGRAYVVGEKRPELFVPSTSGTIIPRVPSGGGGVIEVRLGAGLEASWLQKAGMQSVMITQSASDQQVRGTPGMLGGIRARGTI